MNNKDKPLLSSGIIPPKVLEWSKRDANYFHSFRWKILSIAIVGALGFLLYLGFTLNVVIKNTHHLSLVGEQAMPVMHDLQNATFELRLTKNALQEAAITGDYDLINNAKDHAEYFRQYLRSLSSVDKSKSRMLFEEFNTYYRFSERLAVDMSQNNVIDFSESRLRGEKSTRLYGVLVQRLEQYNAERSDYFKSELEEAISRSENLFSIGLVGGLTMMVIIFTIASLTIRRINGRISHFLGSLKKLAIDSSDMSAKIDVQGTDEMAELAHWFNAFVSRLNFLTMKSNEQIHRMAFSDALTQLPNRREFVRCLESELEFIKQNKDKTLAVFFMDLDNFKSVNDQKGHDAGDTLIRDVAASLQSVIRSYDLLGFAGSLVNDSDDMNTKQERGIVARMGGDEFILLLSNIDNAADVEKIANRILKKLAKVHVIQGTEFLIGVSIGIALYHGDDVDTEDLINRADGAMYQAKNGGKNTFVFHDNKAA